VLAGHLNLAICYLKLGRHRQARDACDAALQLEPSNIKALYRHGLVSRLPYMKSTIPLNHWLGSQVVSVLDSGAEGLGSDRSHDAVG